MKKILISILSIIIIFVIFSQISFAQETEGQINPNSLQGKLDKVRSEAGYAPANGQSMIHMVSLIIKSILGLLGIVFLILTIISGFQWMLSNGNEEIIKKAKSRMKNSVLGLGIIFLSFAISSFIFDILIQ